MLVIPLLLALQSPPRIEAAPVSLSVAVLDAEPSDTATNAVVRLRLLNDSKSSLRVRSPLWHTDDAASFQQCVLWIEGKKPRALSTPIDGRKNFLLFDDADMILAGGETVALAIRCEKSGTNPPRLDQAILAEPGRTGKMAVGFRQPSAP